MRIAIVNDMKMTVELLKQIVLDMHIHEIAWIAEDGRAAVEKCLMDIPDLILMDIVMPVMDGVKATEQIMKNSPCAILIVTASVGVNASKVFEAMGFGALDVVKTPSLIPNKKADKIGADLQKKIQIIENYLRPSQDKYHSGNPHSLVKPKAVPALLVIGASTGGPMALTKLLNKLPADTACAVVIIQHVDEQFAEGFARWLGKQIPMSVKLAEDGEELKAGRVLVAGKNMHLFLDSQLSLHYQHVPAENIYCPSIDVFFNSIEMHWPEPSIAVLLTGMGNDGAKGLKALHTKGWYTIAQNKETCVVFGMPKSAIELGGVSDILSIDEMPQQVMNRLAVQAKKRPSA